MVGMMGVMGLGLWFMVYGFMVYGLWVYGLWFMGYGFMGLWVIQKLRASKILIII